MGGYLGKSKMYVRRIVPTAWSQLLLRAGNQKGHEWVCRSCSAKFPYPARFSTSRRSLEKPYYVTTPIFYVNAAPHVGHLYTMVLSDILKRWQVLRGKQAILCTGTDEHGMKIQRAAAQAQTPPKEFCDLTAETFKSLAKRAGLSNDHFVRTTDPDHREAVQYFWQMLKEREYIYESKHEGWYCVSDETYYPESTIERDWIHLLVGHLWHHKRRVRRLNGHLRETITSGCLLLRIVFSISTSQIRILSSQQLE